MRRFTFMLCLVMAALAVPSAQARKPRPTPPAAAAAVVPAAPAGPSIAPALVASVKARAIGPAVMGGRVSDIALDPVDPYTFYVALAHGGVMKTADAGATFEAVFDDQPAASVGAVAVAPSDPKVIWVGTGEANDRNSSGWGHGVYRSTDGGGTWTEAGLKDSRTIARIRVHPKDPATAWVAVTGDLWTASPERGLYKTTDGGKTWKPVLQAAGAVANKVGCGDVAIDPADPNVVYAALYARVRTPWSFTAGPDASNGQDAGGIFKSTDGGATWKKLGGGLPALTGRLGLDVYAKNPRIVYAIVQSDEGGTSNIDEVKSKRGGVFRSEDAGETWTRMNALNPRPFYFSQIRVSPENDQVVYVLGYMIHVSEDGGKSFREDRFKNVHPDCHALAIDPRTPARIILGTDGGPYQSYDRGERWVHLDTIAAGEFYRIQADLSTPYRLCGGLQDNLNWVGPSATRSKDGILNSDWIDVGGGDGFYCVFDPDDPDVVYAESQSGYVHRFNMRTGELKSLRPEPAEGQTAFRFHWNAPLIPSLHAKGTMYLAGNRVFRLADKGERWQAISPDLSTQDVGKILTTGSGAETFGVVYALAESPKKAGLLWAGTDDGKLWVTEDDGKTWTDLTAGLPAAAKGQWIGRIHASWHDAQVAYLAVDAHRTGSLAPLAWRTADLGKTWTTVTGDLPPDAPVRVLRDDPQNPNLLYAGTEAHFYISVDRGSHWIPFGGLPTVAVDDVLVHPRDDDLIIATHGRSLYIVDDVRPLQMLTGEVADKAVFLFPPRPAFGFYLLPGWVDSAGVGIYRGENPPAGAILQFYIKAFTGDPVKIAIKDAAGGAVANLSAPGMPGLNRVVWDLRMTKDLLTEYGGEGQKFVKPGEYEVTLTFGGVKQTQKLKVEIAAGIETR